MRIVNMQIEIMFDNLDEMATFRERCKLSDGHYIVTMNGNKYRVVETTQSIFEYSVKLEACECHHIGIDEVQSDNKTTG